jgi:hypothetical protein
VFVCPGIYHGICYGIYLATFLENCHARKNIKKIMVSHNVCQAHLLEVGLTKIPGNHETLFIVYHVELHVAFSSMKYSLNL